MTREEAREQLECIYTEVSTETDREAINMAIEALKEPKQGEWTPCSEKLPEKMGFYLVTDMSSFDIVSSFGCIFKFSTSFFMVSRIRSSDFTERQ